MTKKELIKKLNVWRINADTELGHTFADRALIEYIDDPDIKEAYEALNKWYA